MGFRLIPVIEGAPIPWPRLRGFAFWALLAGVLLRTAEALADYGAAVACLGASVLGAVIQRRTGL